MVRERKGTRVFEKVSRWNTLEHTIITSHNINAKYADNADSGNTKLFITYFKRDNKIYPLNRFEKLAPPIVLEDFSQLVMKDTESDYWLELDQANDKIRVYREVSHAD